MHADILLHNGTVFNGPGRPKAGAVAIAGGTILALGSGADLEPLCGPATRRIDLAGRAAIPAFNDCHMHMIPLGRSLGEIDLSPGKVRSIPALLAGLRDRAAATPPGQWIHGGRYDHFALAEARHPTQEELDRAAPRNPVYLTRMCHHVGVGNSLAFRAGGIDEGTPDPDGGHIERRGGRLTGQLQENAQRLVLQAMPALTLEETVQAIEDAGRHMLRFGVASVMDAAVGLTTGALDMAGFQTACRTGRLPVRTYMAILAGPDGIADACSTLGLVTGAGDEYLKVGPAKLFADGSAGGKTAAMTTPYLGDPSNRGIFIHSDADMRAMVADYMARGFQIAVHTIGDAAIEQVLGALEAAIDTPEKAARRHRLEHCGFVRPAQIARMVARAIMPVPQPCFITNFGDLYASVLGEAATARSYPVRTWIEAGLRPGASTDTPVCPPDTMANLAALLTRRAASGKVYGADQCVDLEMAIEAMTFNGAFGSHSETVKGRIAPGQLADIAVLDHDIFASDPDRIAGGCADITIVAGKVAFDRHAGPGEPEASAAA